MFRSIVVGTDGSATASKAVTAAVDLARICGAKLHVVTAYKPLDSLFVGPDVLPVRPSNLPDPEAMARRAAGDAAAGAQAAGVEAEAYACPGDAASTLIDIAESESAELIVVGNRGMSGKARFLLGSVPNKVSHHAPCSVMIVHTC